MPIERGARKAGKAYRAVFKVRRTRFQSPWFRSEEEAKDWEARKRTEIQDGQVVTGRKILVQDFTKLWLEKHAYARKTFGAAVRDESVTRKYIDPRFGSRQLRSLTFQDLDFFFSELARSGTVKPKTVNNCIGTVKKMLSDAVRWGHLSSSPAAALKRFEVPDEEVTYLYRDEVAKLLAYAAVHRPHEHEIILFALNTGCRLGECVALSWGKVDLGRRTALISATWADKERRVVERTKGKRIRQVPLNSEALSLFRRMHLLGRKAEDLVFARVSYSALTNHGGFARLLRRSGLKDALDRGATFHSLRHTFASEFMRAGGGLWDLQKLLGHATITQTEKYAHFAPGHTAGLTDRVGFATPQGERVPVPTAVPKTAISAS